MPVVEWQAEPEVEPIASVPDQIEVPVPTPSAIDNGAPAPQDASTTTTLPSAAATTALAPRPTPSVAASAPVQRAVDDAETHQHGLIPLHDSGSPRPSVPVQETPLRAAVQRTATGEPPATRAVDGSPSPVAAWPPIRRYSAPSRRRAYPSRSPLLPSRCPARRRRCRSRCPTTRRPHQHFRCCSAMRAAATLRAQAPRPTTCNEASRRPPCLPRCLPSRPARRRRQPHRHRRWRCRTGRCRQHAPMIGPGHPHQHSSPTSRLPSRRHARCWAQLTRACNSSPRRCRCNALRQRRRRPSRCRCRRKRCTVRRTP